MEFVGSGFTLSVSPNGTSVPLKFALNLMIFSNSLKNNYEGIIIFEWIFL